jgi:hypothetical protein
LGESILLEVHEMAEFRLVRLVDALDEYISGIPLKKYYRDGSDFNYRKHEAVLGKQGFQIMPVGCYIKHHGMTAWFCGRVIK